MPKYKLVKYSSGQVDDVFIGSVAAVNDGSGEHCSQGVRGAARQSGGN